MVAPEQLLDFAFHVVTDARPSEVATRRAISACYYALFHALTRAAANLLQVDADLRLKFMRSFEHGSLSRAAADIVRRHGKGEPSSDPALLEVAESLLRLREARERADYDLDAEIGVVEAEELWLEASDALDSLKRLKGDPETSAFLLSPFLRSRGIRG